MYIVFEGPDKVGKTTVMNAYLERIKTKGLTDVVSLCEPSPEAKQKLLALKPPSSQEEVALFLEDRRTIMKTVVGPALRDKSTVISDRSFISTFVYQGKVLTDILSLLELMRYWVIRPNLIIYLDSPTDIIVERQGKDHFDDKNASEVSTIRERYSVLKSIFSCIPSVTLDTSTIPLEKLLDLIEEAVFENYSDSYKYLWAMPKNF